MLLVTEKKITDASVPTRNQLNDAWKAGFPLAKGLLDKVGIPVDPECPPFPCTVSPRDYKPRNPKPAAAFSVAAVSAAASLVGPQAGASEDLGDSDDDIIPVSDDEDGATTSAGGTRTTVATAPTVSGGCGGLTDAEMASTLRPGDLGPDSEPAEVTLDHIRESCLTIDDAVVREQVRFELQSCGVPMNDTGHDSGITAAPAASTPADESATAVVPKPDYRYIMVPGPDGTQKRMFMGTVIAVKQTEMKASADRMVRIRSANGERITSASVFASGSSVLRRGSDIAMLFVDQGRGKQVTHSLHYGRVLAVGFRLDEHTFKEIVKAVDCDAAKQSKTMVVLCHWYTSVSAEEVKEVRGNRGKATALSTSANLFRFGSAEFNGTSCEHTFSPPLLCMCCNNYCVYGNGLFRLH